jgi:hypothetical protein
MAKSLTEFKVSHDPQTIIARLTAELRDAQKVSADATALKEALGTAALQLDRAYIPEWTQRLAKGGAPGVPTLFLSDLHWGEVVFPGQVNGINEYSLSIAHKRLRYTIETAVYLLKIISPSMEYPGIVVPLGGDMISGDIHEELQTTNELATMPTVLDLFEQLVATLKLLIEQFGAVFCPCVSGNHGRNTKKIWAKNRNHTSFDWMLYQLLAKHFAAIGEKRITFYVPDGSDAYYKVYNTRYLLTHGDQFKAGDSIIGPIGPLTRGQQKKQARNSAVDMPFDVMIAGHWHQYIHLERLIVNGSLKGYDEYAYSGNFAFEPPRQGLWLTHPKYGLTYRMPVLCEQPRATGKSEWVSVPK